MKKIYKAGDKIKISDFSKGQSELINDQIDLLNSDQVGLNYFSQKLKKDSEILFELIKQSAPVLKDYHYTVEHKNKMIKIMIDRRLTGE